MRLRHLPMLALLLLPLCLPEPAHALDGPELSAPTVALAQVDTSVAPAAPSLGGVYATAAAPEGAPVVNPDDMAGLALVLLEAIKSRRWSVVISAAVVLLILLLRRFGGAFIPWLNSRTAGWVLPLMSGGGAAVVSALLVGQDLLPALIDGLLTGLTSIGLFSLSKNAGQAAGFIPAAPKVTNTAGAAPVLRRTGMGPHP